MKKSVRAFARLSTCAVSVYCSALILVWSNNATATESGTQPEELLVVASRLPTALPHIGSSVSVLSEQQIADLNTGYAADMLRHVPGVAVSRSGGFGGPTQIRLRGAEANHTVVLIDGINVSAAESGEFDFSGLLTQDITRIEVLRGPQSGLYGSNALAGVISIQTQYAAAPQDGFALTANAETGDHALRHGNIALGLGNERINGWLSLTERRSDLDLSVDDSIIGPEDDQDRNQSMLARVNATLTDQLSIHAFARLTDRETETDGFDFSGSATQGLPIDDASATHSDDSAVGVRALLQIDRFTGSLRYNRSESELDGGFFGSESQRSELTIDAAYQWQLTGITRQRSVLYAQTEEESFRNPYPFDPSQAPTFERDLKGIGVEHQIGINDWIFVNGTFRHDDNDDFDDANTFSVNTSLLLNQGDTKIHASLGTAVTNPTFFEQFGFVPGNFVGNPDLQPEKSRAWDIGVEQKLLADQLTIDLTYFDANLENEISSSFPSVINTRGESERQGVELSFSFAHDRFNLTGHYTYLDASEPDGDEVRRPQHTGALNLAFPWLNERGRFTAGVIYNGSMLDSDFRNFFTNGFVTERTRLDRYTVVNLGASFVINSALEGYVRLENALNEDYEELIGYATPGRGVYAGVRLRFR